jgi:hypothetical protein
MQTENDETILSEDNAEQVSDENLKLVPVGESIRYRKRAQSAEKKAETLAEELAQAKTQISEMNEQLSNIQLEQKLVKKLSAAGVVDLETAVLVAKTRLTKGDEADLDGCVEQLKKEKQHLFGSGNAATSKKTSGVRDRQVNAQSGLERAAKRAAKSGSRTDLQEYLKLRRNLL